MKRVILFVALITGLSGFPTLASTLEVHAPVVRMVPPGQMVSAVFLNLHNNGSRSRSLIAARSDVADAVELHNHTMEEGMMKMRRVDAISVPSYGEVALKPSGLHIMLIGLTRNLKPGDQVAIELEFADSERLPVIAVVKMVGSEKDHSDHSE